MKTTDPSLDIVRQFFLEENPNPERVGCPPEETLNAAAENRLPVNDPARLHMADCSECFAEYRGYRLDWESKQSAKRRFVGWAVAAGLLVAVAGGAFALRHHFGSNEVPQQIAINTPPRGGLAPPKDSGSVTPAPKQEDPHKPTRLEPRPPRHSSSGNPALENPPIDTRPIGIPAPATENNELVSAVIDLRANQIPGGPPRARTQTFVLPASNLKLKVVLPSTAQSGVYTLRLTRDIDGKDVVASATGETVLEVDVLSLDVKMLLNGKAAGPYHLFVGPTGDGEPTIYDVRIVADQPSSAIK